MTTIEHNSQQTKHNSQAAATNVADAEEVKQLKNMYKDALEHLKEVFAGWSEEDLLFTLQDAEGDLETAVNRISEGRVKRCDL